MADRKFRGDIELRGRRKGVDAAFARTGKAVDGLARRFKGLAALAGTAAVASVFVGTAQKIREFEKSLSDLSAITGATGDDLLKLEAASKKIGQTTTLSASQAAEAFKLVASAKPDLLSNLDALEATTNAAVTLAEAAGIELPQAADSLGEALNQFGAGAEKADEFINILAAGSKFGSSAIDQTSEALKNAGVVAKLAGLSFEETNAAVQALAFAGVKGSDAGTKLRAVLIKLQNQANDEFNPAVVGINEALDNLAEANLSVSEKTELFGERSIATADILIEQRDNLDRLETQLTGTNTAFEQARIRTDNLDGAMKRMGSAWEAIQLSFKNSGGILRETVDALTDIFNALAAMRSNSDQATEGMGAFDASIKTVFTSGVVLKNLLDSVIDILGFVGRAVSNIISGDFDLLDDSFRELKQDLRSEFDDIGEFAFRTFNPEGAAQLDANMESFFKAPIVSMATETAAAVDEAMTGMTAGEEAAQAAADRHIAQLEAGLERIRVSNLTELELLQEQLATKQELLLEALELELITKEEFDEQIVGLAQQTAERVLRIQQRAKKKELTFEAMSQKQKTKTVLANAVELTAGVAQHSKTLFRINKAAALAQAVVAMPAHISETMSKYPYPISVAMGALAAVASLAQINAIRSTSFSGGGGGTTPSMAGSTPTVNDIPSFGGESPLALPVGGGGGTGARIDINIEGLDEAGVMPASSVRDLIESIGEELGEGVSFNIAGETGGG